MILLESTKVEKAPCLSGGDRGGRELQVLNTQVQEHKMEWENARRPVENIFVELKTISAEWHLLSCKVTNLWLWIPAGLEGFGERRSKWVETE